MKPRQAALRFIFITLFLDILGIGLIIPILPRLVEQLQGGNVAAASHTVGWLAALYCLMQFVFAPILGCLSDRYGRRPVILASLLGAGLDYLLLAFAPSLAWLYFGRLVSGITGANITAASAYIADVSPPEKRAANFGMIGAAFGLGFIAGPALGGILGDIGLRIPFFAAAGLNLFNWLYGVFVLPESLKPEHRRPFALARANPVGSLLALREFPMVFGLAGTFFLINVAQYGLHSTWVLYTGYRYGWTPREVGGSLAAVGIMTAIVQGGLARRIIPWLGEPKSLVVGLTIGALGMVGYGAATESWMIYAILGFASFGGIAGPAAQGLVSRSTPPDQQGAVQGALTSMSSVAGVLAPLLATSLFGWFIGPAAPRHLPGAPFYFGALLMVVAVLLARRSFARIDRSTPSDLPLPPAHPPHPS